ncbi:energy-coupled thiamine transporter ThiT [Clostridium sp. UBA4548]|uniref:energy-coupled thiamine transporter ThiT n=1 Tax=Clostridium sp. UBA4548 TaxID=1946361 RepID=UPI0025C1D7DB|nr:energy-coupled thiamine transporter ThiT [Clostridium sp. UBA4548]
MSFTENLKEILSNKTTIITLIGVLIMMVSFTRIKKVKLTSRLMAHIGLALALSTVLQFFKLFELPYGGSATLGSMLPIIVISLLYGPTVGVLTGFLYGLVNFVIGPAYILHPIQVLFDYSLPFMAIGLAGVLKNNRILAVIFAFLCRFVFHFISGVVFFGDYAKEGMSPILYSFLYNGGYLLADCLICVAIISVVKIDLILKKTNGFNNAA